MYREAAIRGRMTANTMKICHPSMLSMNVIIQITAIKSRRLVMTTYTCVNPLFTMLRATPGKQAETSGC
jgi:hypothetical protein